MQNNILDYLANSNNSVLHGLNDTSLLGSNLINKTDNNWYLNIVSDQSCINTISSNTNQLLTLNICFPAGTPVVTDQGIIGIDKINTKFHTIHNKKIVCVTKTFSNHDYLVCFEKDSLSHNVPSEKTMMTPDHQILHNGKFIMAERFCKKYENVHKIKYDNKILYNILMEQPNVVEINNLTCETLDPKSAVAKFHIVLNNSLPEIRNQLIKKYNDRMQKNIRIQKH